jgi:hypothetical protein
MSNGGPKLIDGSQLRTSGRFRTQLKHQNQSMKVDWLVADNVEKTILGVELCKKMKLVHQNFPFCEVNQVEMSPEIKLGHGKDLDIVALKYLEVFCGKICGIHDEPATIQLIPDAKPSSIKKYWDIPEANKEPLKCELESQVAQGILEKVEDTEETTWLHPIVVVPKKRMTDVRLCVDFRQLNKQCIRPINPQLTPWEIVLQLPRRIKFFAVFDVLKGYHQVPLEENSKEKMTFWAPFGKYGYKNLPMGYTASQDIFTDQFRRAVDHVIDGNRATEYCLIYGFNRKQFMDWREKFFEACDKLGVTLNIKNVQVRPRVIFAGFELDAEEYQLDPALTEVLRAFPIKMNQTDVRSFMGLANQMTNFSTEIAEVMFQFKDLLKKEMSFIWTDVHQKAFEKAREKLSDSKWLTYFDVKWKTCLQTDVSHLRGLGFILKQEVKPGDWKVVQAGSRFLSEAETRYAKMELEMLAIVWACKKCANFVQGSKFQILTDHKPLILMLRDYSLNNFENK